MKRFFVRGVLVLVSLVLAAFAVDYAARFFDPFGISYYRDNNRYFKEAVSDQIGDPEGRGIEGRLLQQKPGVDLSLKTFNFRTDAFGLRSATAGAELPAPNATERLRVLCLGDSVTLAWGVDDADSWIRVVEREGQTPDGRTLEMLNAGHLMYETVQQADLLRAWGPELEPEVVVLMYIANDLVSTIGSITKDAAKQAEINAAPTLTSNVTRWLRATFPGLRDLAAYYKNAADIAGIPDRAFGSAENIPGYPEGWPRSREALEEIRQRCDELGARFVVFDHSIPQIPELEAWCTEAGVERVDTTFSETEWREDIRNSAVDSHFNPKGNRYIAEKAIAGLRGLGILR